MIQFLTCISSHWMKHILITLLPLLNLIKIFLLLWKVRNGQRSMSRRIKKDGLKKIRKRRKLLYKPQKKLQKNKNNKSLLLKKRNSLLQIIRKSSKILKFRKNLIIKSNRQSQNNRQRKPHQSSKIIRKLNCIKKAKYKMKIRFKKVKIKMKKNNKK